MGFLSTGAIPDHIAKMISPDERRKIGKGAMTLDEAVAKAEDRAEKQLQKDLLALLEAHRGIVVIYSRMDKKATTPPGTPDLIFAVRAKGEIGMLETIACAWEAKTLTGKQSAEQIEMERRMTTTPNAWRYRVIRSVAEARLELELIGLKPRL